MDAQQIVAPLGLDQRRAVLEREIASRVRQGYRVLAQTDTTAQLVKPKSFSAGWAIMWFLVFGVGLVVYLLYYAGKKDQQAYLAVDEAGRLLIGGLATKPSPSICPRCGGPTTLSTTAGDRRCRNCGLEFRP